MRFVEIREDKHEELLHLVKKMKKMACIVEKCLEADEDSDYRGKDKEMDDDDDMDIQYRRGGRGRSSNRMRY